MRVVHPSIYLKRQQRNSNRRKKRSVTVAVFLLMIAGYGALVMRVDPVFTPRAYSISIERQNVPIAWPSVGSASVGYVGQDAVVSGQNGSKVLPTASTIKLYTAILLLTKKPLKLGETGDNLTFTAKDTANYEATKAVNGSAVQVPEGTTITYRQALEYMLVLSANNIADKLVEWVYESNDEFLKNANSYAKMYNLTSTSLADASGLSPLTVSSSNDLVLIALRALDNPVIKVIVNEKNVTLPNGSLATNTNQLLGIENVDGLKTGFTDEAGACLLLSRTIMISGQQIVLVMALLGQPDKTNLYVTAQNILNDFTKGFEEIPFFSRKQIAGVYESPWGTKTAVQTRGEMFIVHYRGESVGASIDLKPITRKLQYEQVGVLSVGPEKVEIELKDDLPSPSFSWRLKHALDFMFKKS